MSEVPTQDISKVKTLTFKLLSVFEIVKLLPRPSGLRELELCVIACGIMSFIAGETSCCTRMLHENFISSGSSVHFCKSCATMNSVVSSLFKKTFQFASSCESSAHQIEIRYGNIGNININLWFPTRPIVASLEHIFLVPRQIFFSMIHAVVIIEERDRESLELQEEAVGVCLWIIFQCHGENVVINQKYKLGSFFVNNWNSVYPCYILNPDQH